MRHIAPEIFSDEYFGSLPMMLRVLWVGLVVAVADDQGRFIDNPALIRSQIFPYDAKISIKEIDNALSSLAKAHKIERYTAGTNGSGKRLVQILNWWKYQKQTQWARESIHPAPVQWLDRIRIHKPGNGNVPYTLHWDTEGGYAEPSKDVPTDLPTHLSRGYTKTKTKTKTKTNNTPTIPKPLPSAKQGRALLAGGGGNKKSSTKKGRGNQDAWMDQLTAHERETAQIITPIMRSCGLGHSKIVTQLPIMATRIKPTDAKRYTLAALASVYADDDIRNKPIVALHRMMNDQVPVLFMNSNTWRKIPAEILKVADVDIDRLPRESSSTTSANDVVARVAANVRNN